MSSIVRTKNGQYLVTIPSALANALVIEPGDKVAWKIINNKTIEMMRLD